MSRPQPARPPLGNAYLFGLLQARRAQTSNQKSMARWAQIWAPKLGPKSGPQIWAPNSSPIGTLFWKEGQGPFFGALPGVRKWSQLCKQVGVWVRKKGSEEKAGKPAANCQHISSRSLGERAAEKIKVTTFRCGLNPHELFTTLWSNRLQLLSWRHETRLRRYLICLIDPWGQMSRPQPARPPLGNAYLFGLLQARRAQTSNQKSMARWAQIWAPKLGPKSGPQIWAPNSSPIGTLFWKEGQGPFFGALPGVRKWSQLCKQVGVWVRKKGSEEKAGKPAANCQHISSRSLGERAAEKIKVTTFRCGLNPHELFTTLLEQPWRA